jgi:hypothetical protein
MRTTAHMRSVIPPLSAQGLFARACQKPLTHRGSRAGDGTVRICDRRHDGRSASAVTSRGIPTARKCPTPAIPPEESALMTVKHYDHTIIDHTDVPTNPLPRHVRIDTSDPKTTSTDRTGIRVASPPEDALLIVERGPDAGSRFLLAQPVRSVGRHPRTSAASTAHTLTGRRSSRPRLWSHPLVSSGVGSRRWGR